MDRVPCDKQSCNPYIYDPGRFKLKEKSRKLSEQYASLSDEKEYSDINVSVIDSDASIHDKTVTLPLLGCPMAKEKVINKRKINANISDVKKPQKKSKQAKANVLKEPTDKFLQIIEDSKERDEDIFTKFFDFVSASDKRNADLTLKLMEGFGNILKDI